MANIRLKELLEANVDPKLVARSKESGKLVYFKTPQAKNAAMKAGSHEDPKAKKGGEPKGDAKPNNMFGKDYNKDRGGEAPKADKPTTSKYDDKSYWKDDERSNTQGYTGDDDDYDDDNSWGEGPQLTSDRLSKIETAIDNEFGKEFSFSRESGGGMGGWEGPMTISNKNIDWDTIDYEDVTTLSVGSPDNDGKFTIGLVDGTGQPIFEKESDSIIGDIALNPQQAYKVTKALMKMPEVQKLLNGKMTRDEFQPIYDKLKSKFSKTESTKLTSMIKK